MFYSFLHVYKESQNIFYLFKNFGPRWAEIIEIHLFSVLGDTQGKILSVM
jgi:hypothetical protein